MLKQKQTKNTKTHFVLAQQLQMSHSEGEKKQGEEQGGPFCCQTEQGHRTSPHKMNYKLQHSTKIVIETQTEHFSHKRNTTEYTMMI